MDGRTSLSRVESGDGVILTMTPSPDLRAVLERNLVH